MRRNRGFYQEIISLYGCSAIIKKLSKLIFSFCKISTTVSIIKSMKMVISTYTLKIKFIRSKNNTEQ